MRANSQQAAGVVLSRQQIAEHLITKEYRFAKTLSHIPHWYTRRREWEDDRAFCDVVQGIREYGYRESFRHYGEFTYFNCNGFKYWTMGNPLHQTILINRAEIDYDTGLFSDYALVHEAMYQINETLDADYLLPYCLGKILEIGVGNGFLYRELENDVLHPEVDVDYYGLEPSGIVLDEIRKEYPDLEGRVFNSTVGDFYGTGFNTVIASHGTASYLTDGELSDLRRLFAGAQGGTSLLLQFHTPNTLPDGYSAGEHGEWLRSEKRIKELFPTCKVGTDLDPDIGEYITVIGGNGKA